MILTISDSQRTTLPQAPTNRARLASSNWSLWLESLATVRLTRARTTQHQFISCSRALPTHSQVIHWALHHWYSQGFHKAFLSPPGFYQVWHRNSIWSSKNERYGRRHRQVVIKPTLQPKVNWEVEIYNIMPDTTPFPAKCSSVGYVIECAFNDSISTDTVRNSIRLSVSLCLWIYRTSGTPSNVSFSIPSLHQIPFDDSNPTWTTIQYAIWHSIRCSIGSTSIPRLLS